MVTKERAEQSVMGRGIERRDLWSREKSKVGGQRTVEEEEGGSQEVRHKEESPRDSLRTHMEQSKPRRDKIGCVAGKSPR